MSAKAVAKVRPEPASKGIERNTGTSSEKEKSLA
jgi:hypothetical protein